MKKRIGSILLSLALCLSLLPAAAFAAEDTTGTHTHYLCGGDICSGGSHSKESSKTTFARKISQRNDNLYIDGTKWTYAYSGSSHQYTLPAGNYYLDTDIEIKGSIQIADTATLCLNGYTITSTEGTVISVVNGEFTLTDCKGESTEYGKITHNNYNGRGVYVNNGTFNMYGGSITRNMANGGNGGGGVRVDSGTFNLYGGSITGNVAKALRDYGGGNGGGVSVKSGAFNMSGGEIHNNTTTGTNDTTTGHGGGVYVGGGTFTMQNGSISGNQVSDGKDGGGVYVNSGTFTMSGGSITGNTAPTTGDGGGVFVNYGGTFQMSDDSLITDNTGFHGGGVCVERSFSNSNKPGAFTMASGTITDNNAEYGGGVYISGNFTMSGGEISSNHATGNSGGVHVNTDGTFTVSGAPKITGNTLKDNTANNVRLAKGTSTQPDATITIGDAPLNTGASIGVTTEKTLTAGSSVTIATGANSGDEKYFTADAGEDYEFKLDGGKVVMSKKGITPPAQKHEHPICGDTSCSETGHQYTGEWTGVSDLSKIETAGNYYLTNNVTLDKTWEPKTDTVLCLNGKTIMANGEFEAIKVGTNVTFTLTDCQTSQGSITHASDAYGRGVEVENGTFNMYGGSITGNNGETMSAGGGGVYVGGGMFNMYGGSISRNIGGSYCIGGGVYVSDSSSTFNLYSGEISGNKGSSGGVEVYGTFNMSGGSITGNKATYGGGVYVNGGTFTMSGGSITNNTAGGDIGGGVCVVDGTFTVSGNVTITDNTADNVYLSNGETITIGGELEDEAGKKASIGVTLESSYGDTAFTSGWGTYMSSKTPSDYFTSDAEGLTAVLDGSEVKLVNGTIAAKTLNSIVVTTAPTKTTYTAGENFDSAGMVVTATYSDSTTAPVTGYTVTDGNALTAGMTSVTISYTEGGVTKTCTQAITVNAATKTLSSIAVTTAPTKTTYTAGENFDSAGMVVTATYSDSSTASVTGYTVTDGNALTSGKTSVTISYTEGGETKTCTQAITVNAALSEFTITFDGNGGTPSTSSMTTTSQKLTSLPNASRSGYTFDGWYTAETGGDKVDITKVYTEDTNLYAHWTGTGSSSSGSSSRPSYTVTAPAKTDNGGVSTSVKSARKGDTVTVTVTPDKGYVLESLTVLDQNGKELALTDKGDGKYTFTMPAGKVEIKASFMEDNTMLNYFVDVKNGDYFYDAVLWAAQQGITSGTDAEHFSPNAPCTRAQIVTFLWRAAGSPVVDYAMELRDVPGDAYYAEAVRWALSEGITGGTDAEHFSPDAPCTREQAVTFLYRASGSPAVSGGSAFTDVADSDYYASAVAWAERNGVTGGIGGGLFGSGSGCTRAQIVVFLFKTYSGR